VQNNKTVDKTALVYGLRAFLFTVSLFCTSCTSLLFYLVVKQANNNDEDDDDDEIVNQWSSWTAALIKTVEIRLTFRTLARFASKNVRKKHIVAS